MFVTKISVIGYIENETHTLAFNKFVKISLGMSQYESHNRFKRDVIDVDSFEYFVAENYEEGKKVIQEFLKDYLNTVFLCKDFAPNTFNDFYFRFVYSEVIDGKFTKPYGNDFRIFNLETLEEI